jgi:hypothetical protein
LGLKKHRCKIKSKAGKTVHTCENSAIKAINAIKAIKIASIAAA